MDQNTNLWSQSLQSAALSDVGLRRANNQDSMAVVLASDRQKWRTQGHLFIVADGMGAHAAGELASKLATDIVPLSYTKCTDRPPPEALQAAVEDANQQIHSRGQASEDFHGMGTTASALVLLPQGALLAHVGDSRAYRLRNHRLEQLTFDHSLVWEMRAAGKFGDGETPDYIPKNVITRSLGPHPEVKVDLEGPHPLEVGDTFLLCSDGLSGLVEDDEIGKILASMSPEEAVRSLVDLANLRGGSDNITIVCVRVIGPEATRAGLDGASDTTPTKRGPIPPVVLSLLGLFALGALGLGVLEIYLGALVCLIGALVTGIVAFVQRYGGSGDFEFDGPLGKGPYTSTDAAPDLEFVDRLKKISNELHAVATKENWNVDWTRFDTHGQQAAASTKANDFATAIRHFCHAISFLMSELKNQRGR